MKFVINSHCTPESDLFQQWCALAETPLERPEWLLSWWNAFQGQDDSNELMLVTVFDGSRLVALSPLYRQRTCLRLLGDGQACTDHIGLLIGDNSLDKCNELLGWLLQKDQRELWQQMDLECVDNSHSTVASITDSTELNQIQETTGSCYVNLPPNMDDYLASLSKNHRKRCRRWERKYFEGGLIRTYSTYVDSRGPNADVQWSHEDAFKTLADIHNERRAEIDEGAFEDPRFAEFLSSAFNQLARIGMAEISAIEIEGAIQAVEFELHSPNTTFAYQSGLATSGLEHAAGSLSLMTRIRNAIESDKAKYDFMRGIESYKFHWGAQIENASRLLLWQPGMSGRLARSKAAIFDFSKDMVRGFVRS